MKPRLRFIVVLFAVFALAAFCGSRINAQDRAKPRERGQSSSERKREAQPQERRQRPSGEAQSSRPQREERAERNDAERRRPQPRAQERRDNDDRRGRDADRQRDYDRNRDNDRTRPGLSDAQRRHPQPDGRYDRGRDNRRDWDRYHWRSWDHRNRYDRDRFPRFYFGLRLFDGRYYRGYGFGPHYRLWYYDRSWQMFYWPYAYAPLYGCREYLVPTDRQLVYDPATGEEYWDYTDYRRIYVCFN